MVKSAENAKRKAKGVLILIAIKEFLSISGIMETFLVFCLLLWLDILIFMDCLRSRHDLTLTVFLRQTSF